MGTLRNMAQWAGRAFEPDPDFNMYVFKPEDLMNAGRPFAGGSAVASCVDWLARNFLDAQLVLYESGTEVKEHALLTRLDNPYDDYSKQQMFKMLVFDYYIHGKCFLWKVPNITGGVAALRVLPAKHTKAFGDDEEDGFASTNRSDIAGFKTKINGKDQNLKAGEVVYIRWIPNGLDAISPLDSARYEIESDFIAASYELHSMKNPRPDSIIGPRSVAGRPPKGWKDDDIKRLNEKLGDRNNTTGGKIVALSEESRVQQVGFTPDDMSLNTSTQRFESRIAAVTGIPPLLVGLIVGLRWANTRSTATALLRKAYNDALQPLHDEFLAVFNKSLAPDFGTGLELKFNYDTVRELSGYLQEEAEIIHDSIDRRVLSPEQGFDLMRYDKKLEAVGSQNSTFEPVNESAE